MNAKNHLAQTQAALEALDHEAIDRAGTTLVEALDQGGVIYTCGNGGTWHRSLLSGENQPQWSSYCVLLPVGMSLVVPECRTRMRESSRGVRKARSE